MFDAGPAPLGRWARFSGFVVRARLFAVSYAPLVLIAAFRSLPCWRRALGIAVVAAVIVYDGWRLVHRTRRRNIRVVQLADVRDQGGAVAGYLATYLLPFLSTNPIGVGDGLAYVVYFLVALLVYVRSDLTLINPTLYVFGWRVVEADHAGRRVLVLCRDVPSEGSDVEVVAFLDVYVVTRR